MYGDYPQNGVVERKHQHILNTTRALLFQSGIPQTLWTFALAHAIFIINRLPSKALQNQIPYQLLHAKPPNLHFLKVFGCQCFASTLVFKRKKLDPCARHGVYLGHRTGVKGFLVYDLKTREIFVSRNVTFHEHIFPFQQLVTKPLPPPIVPTDCPTNTFNDHYYTSKFTLHDTLNTHFDNSTSANTNNDTLSAPAPALVPENCKSQRQHRPPAYLQDFHCSLATSAAPDPPITTILYPISNYLS